MRIRVKRQSSYSIFMNHFIEDDKRKRYFIVSEWNDARNCIAALVTIAWGLLQGQCKATVMRMPASKSFEPLLIAAAISGALAVTYNHLVRKHNSNDEKKNTNHVCGPPQVSELAVMQVPLPISGLAMPMAPAQQQMPPKAATTETGASGKTGRANQCELAAAMRAALHRTRLSTVPSHAYPNTLVVNGPIAGQEKETRVGPRGWREWMASVRGGATAMARRTADGMAQSLAGRVARFGSHVPSRVAAAVARVGSTAVMLKMANDRRAACLNVRLVHAIDGHSVAFLYRPPATHPSPRQKLIHQRVPVPTVRPPTVRPSTISSATPNVETAKECCTIIGDPHAVNGEGSAVLMVLVHGFSGDKDVWLDLCVGLPVEWGLLVPDLPGAGQSSRDWSASYDVRTQSDRMWALVDRVLGEEVAVHLVGSSMGGNVVGRMAADRPNRVASLCLIGALGVGSPILSPTAEAILSGPGNPLLPTTRAEFAEFMALMFGDARAPAPRFIIDALADRVLEHTGFNRKVFADLADKPDELAEALPRTASHVPTTIIWGANDRVIDPSAGHLFHKLLPSSSQLVILERCGHLPMIEHPAPTADALVHLVDRAIGPILPAHLPLQETGFTLLATTTAPNVES
jgi:pimeloyl-ACP methyl ester carboxylesterase